MNDQMGTGQYDYGRSSAPGSNGGAGGGPLMMILMCAALGFVASAVEYERVAATSERNRAEMMATACSATQGQLEDLGRFLSDPNTRLITLAAPEGNTAKRAVIAWNAADRTGYFLCDELPILDSGTDYELWALHGSDAPVKLASIGAKPGDSVYPLGSWAGMEGKIHVEITAGPRSVEKRPVFSGEIE